MRIPSFPSPTNPLGLVIKLLTCGLLFLTIHREIREIRKEKRGQAKEDK